MSFLKKNFSKLNNSTITHCWDDIFQNFHTLTECPPLFLNVLICEVDTSQSAECRHGKVSLKKREKDTHFPGHISTHFVLLLLWFVLNKRIFFSQLHFLLLLLQLNITVHSGSFSSKKCKKYIKQFSKYGQYFLHFFIQNAPQLMHISFDITKSIHY